RRFRRLSAAIPDGSRRAAKTTVQVGDSAQFEPSLQRINTDIENCGTETRRSTRPYDIDLKSLGHLGGKHRRLREGEIFRGDGYAFAIGQFGAIFFDEFLKLLEFSDRRPSVIHSSEACAV